MEELCIIEMSRSKRSCKGRTHHDGRRIVNGHPSVKEEGHSTEAERRENHAVAKSMMEEVCCEVPSDGRSGL